MTNKANKSKAGGKFDFGELWQRITQGTATLGHRLASWTRAALTPERRKRTLAISGSSLAMVLLLALVALPEATPEEQQTQLALSGGDLYESLMKRRPELRDDSRIEPSATQAATGNRLVLPQDIWQLLDIEQRISLGTWLETIGGRWEIRIGTMTADGTAIENSEPVMDSQAWNRQLK